MKEHTSCLLGLIGLHLPDAGWHLVPGHRRTWMCRLALSIGDQPDNKQAQLSVVSVSVTAILIVQSFVSLLISRSGHRNRSPEVRCCSLSSRND